jgi:hypothetical protein
MPKEDTFISANGWASSDAAIRLLYHPIMLIGELVDNRKLVHRSGERIRGFCQVLQHLQHEASHVNTPLCYQNLNFGRKRLGKS